MANYPTSLDTLTNPASTDEMDDAGVLHDVQHSDLNDIAEALEAKVGTGLSNASGASSGDVLIADGAGGTSWGAQTDTTDHGALSGLADDDHTQYLTSGRHDSEDHSTALSTAVIADLSNVVITSVADNEVLAYNSGTGDWVNQTAAEAGLAVSGHGHDHGNLTGLADDDHTQYLNVTRHDAEDHSTAMSSVVVNDIGDVVISAPANNEVLAYNSGTGDWINQTAAEAGLATSGHGHSFSDHGALTGLGDDDHTQYLNNSRHNSLDHSTALGTATIGDLSGVTITSVTNDEVLAWNGSAWVNQTAAEAGLATSGHSHSFSDHGALTGLSDDDHTQYLNNSRHNSLDHSTALGTAVIADLSDVTITSVANNEVLAYNGAGLWINQTAAEAGLATASHTHPAGDVVSGTFADARISASSVQQHVDKTYVDSLNVDADTLDSLNSTQFVRSDADDTVTGRLTFQRAGTTGDSTTYPRIEFEDTAATTQGMEIRLNVYDGDLPETGYGLVVGGRTGGAAGTKMLIVEGPIYADSTNRVLTTADEGSGNGLDADTVDGQEASAFAPAAEGVTNGDSHNHAGGDGAQIDHGGLAGLGDDDHTQYLNTTRHTALSGDHVTNGDSHNHAGGDGAQIDHGGLAGLGDNDHTQYALVAGDTFTGQILVPAGSAANPAIAFSGDTDVGIYFSAGTIHFSVGGTEVGAYNSGGLVLI